MVIAPDPGLLGSNRCEQTVRRTKKDAGGFGRLVFGQKVAGKGVLNGWGQLDVSVS